MNSKVDKTKNYLVIELFVRIHVNVLNIQKTKSKLKVKSNFEVFKTKLNK